MEIKKNLTTINYWLNDGNGNTKNNKFIVIHYVGAVSSAYNNTQYFKSIERGASANYFVDDKSIYQCVEDKNTAFHCGTKKTYYNDCRNTNSIGIEMCCYMSGNTLDISDLTITNTIGLVQDLMAKYGIPIENVVRHYDVTHKKCPAPFVDDVNRWYDFLDKVKGETLEITKIDSKKVILNKDANLWNLDFKTYAEAESIKSFKKGDIFDVVAIANHPIGSKYYLTEYSYSNKIDNGINIKDCDDYVESVIDEIPAIIEEDKETVLKPILEPIEEKIDNSPIIDEKVQEIEVNGVDEPIIEETEPVIKEEYSYVYISREPEVNKSLFQIIIDFIINLFTKGGK